MNILENVPKKFGIQTGPTELTPRQDAVYRWIGTFLKTHGHPPTLREIGKATGMTSPNGVLFHVKTLIRKGFLRSTGEKLASRGLVLNVPEGHCPCCGQRLPDDIQSQIESKP